MEVKIDPTRHPFPRKKGAGSALPLLLAATLLGNHLSCHKRIAGVEEGAESIAWPAPPAAARIEFVRSFRKPADLGIRKNWVARFFRRLGSGRRAPEMKRPHGVAVGGDGTVLVADPESRCLHIFDPQRSRYHRVEEAGGRRLESPIGVATDGAGRIYLSDSGRRELLRFDSRGRWLDTLADGRQLQRPTGLALDSRLGVLHVVDTLGHRILSFDLDGNRLREIGRRGNGDGEFNFPVAIAVDGRGRLFVSDAMNFRIQILDPEGRFLGSFGRAGDGPGDFDKTKGIAVDAAGHIYVVEALHDVVHVFDMEGRLLTVIGGTGTRSGEFWLPAGIHIDGQARIWVSDSANHRVQILKILDPPPEGASG